MIKPFLRHGSRPLLPLPTLALLAVVLWAPRPRDERGDVPGWVLVVVMTAGLVSALWAVAGPQLQAILTAALASVGGS